LFQQMLDISSAYTKTFTFQAVVHLGIADFIEAHGTSQTSAQLAIQTGTNPEFLYRLLRYAATFGFFKEVEADKWENTELSKMTAQPAVQAFTCLAVDLQVPSWTHLEKCVRTGKEVFSETHNGVGFWSFLKQNPNEAQKFNMSMSVASSRQIPSILKAYDWTKFKTLIDLGGGAGHLLAAILQTSPNANGIVFDLPDVIENSTKPYIATTGLSDRVQFVAGSFLEDVKATADAIMVKSTLHDWNDEECIKILKCCRSAIKPNGKLFIIEWVLSECGESREIIHLDIVMMVNLSGKERTEAQWRTVISQAGYRIDQIIPTGKIALIECSPV